MNILVTGGTGFIGEYFIPRLLKAKYNVTLLVRNYEKAFKMFENKVSYIIGDVTDSNSLKDCCKGMDIVFHMVAKVGNDLNNEYNNNEFNKVNVEGTRNLMIEAQKANVKRFIYVSSIAAMGIVKDGVINETSRCNPILPYQKSKYNAEKMLVNEYKINGFPVIIVRPTKVYGCGEREYSLLKQLKLCKKKICLVIGKKENYISYIHIKDFVEALVLCIINGKEGEIYNLSGPNSISSKEIGDVVAEYYDYKMYCVRIPKTILGVIAYIEERLFWLFKKKPLITYLNVCAMSEDRIYDLTKAKEELKYIPRITMQNGIKEMIKWYEKSGVL